VRAWRAALDSPARAFDSGAVYETPATDFAYAFVALLVVVDPAGTAVMFAAMTPRDSFAEKTRQAKRACAIAFAVLTVFGLGGEALLHALGIGLPALQVAGGILLFLTAADMVTARGELRATRAEQQVAAHTEDISVFPLAIPLIAGPGAMTTMVLLQSAGRGYHVRGVVVEVALVAVVALQLVALLAAGWITRMLGKTGANVVGRVLGVLLAALAAQITLDGLRAALWP
jgi:multiple antibiotic resistance protein